MMRSRHTFAAIVGGAIGLSALLQGGAAQAGHAHFSGGVHVGGRVSGGVRFAGPRYAGSVRYGYARPARSYYYHRYYHRPWAGGRVYIGGYYPYAYGYYPYYPEVVPSYYGTTYYPVVPQPAVAVAAPMIPAEPPLPTFGIGVFGGSTSVGSDDHQESTDFGGLARVRLGQSGLLLEGEIAKTKFKDDVRVDRRIGGSLIYEIGAHNAFAPYVLAGGGVNQADVDGSFSTRQEYGEIGVGLRWALSRNLHLTLDVRAGERQAYDSTQPVEVSATARSVAPPSGVNGSNDTEDYTRARLAAILNF